MQKQIKTTLNYLIQFFLLVFPFWISRLWLIFSNQDLSIDNVINYLFYARRFDLKTMAIWYAPLFILLGIQFLNWQVKYRQKRVFYLVDRAASFLWNF